MTDLQNLTTGPWPKIRGHVDVHRVTPLFLSPDRHPDPWVPAVVGLVRHEAAEGRPVAYFDASTLGSNARRLRESNLDWTCTSVRAASVDGSDATIDVFDADDTFFGDNVSTFLDGAAVVIVDDVIALLNRHSGDPGTAWLDLNRFAAGRAQPVIGVVHGLDHRLLRDVRSAGGAYRFTEVSTGEQGRPWDEATFATLRATGELPSARFSVLD